jgi:predicted phosphodiesterase
VIGDVHGQVEEYHQILLREKPDFSIQVGDFGFLKAHAWHRDTLDPLKHWVNFGNHDYYPMLNVKHSLGNHSWMPSIGVFTVRGAESIDKHHRTEGIDWFPEEALSYLEANQALEDYKAAKPRIVISHDGPDCIVKPWFFEKFNVQDVKSNTRQLLDAMLDAHQPEQWFFGHHHVSQAESIDGTAFRCLAELQPGWVL